MTASADFETILGGFVASESLIPKYQRLFTDKLAFRWSELLGLWSLDSATPATPAYPAHASGPSDEGGTMPDEGVRVSGEAGGASLPLSANRCLLVVAPGGTEPDESVRVPGEFCCRA